VEGAVVTEKDNRAADDDPERKRKGKSDKRLVTLDPESGANFELLRDIIEEEIRVRLATGDGPDKESWTVSVASLAADEVLHQFEVTVRSTPRYRWEDA
jgi:hypothetical protein